MDKYVIIPLLCLILCQAFKAIIESIKCKKLCLKRAFGGSGGIPSSHTTLITSIMLLIGLDNNFKGELFGLAIVSLLIICYDSIGIRREVEKHSRLLNKVYNQNYKEEMGHNLYEVIAGIIFGIIVTLLLNNLF